MRSGASGSSSASWMSSSAWLRLVRSRGPLGLVQHHRLLGVAGHGLLQRPLVAALRHPDADPAAPQAPRATPRSAVGVRRAAPARGSRAGTPSPVSPAYSWSRKRSTRPPRSASSVFSATQPRWPRTRPPRTWKTCTATSSGSSSSGDDVGVGAVAEHDGLLLQRPVERPEVVAEPGGPLEVHARRTAAYISFSMRLTNSAVLPGHEVAEVLDDRAVLLGADLAHAGRRALVDVAEQAGPADLAARA